MRGIGKMAIVKNPFHPRCSFQYWLGRLALAAMLALVLMPTAGRFYLGGGGPSAAFAGAPSITLQVAGHGDHATAHQDVSPEAPVAPGPRHATHADCPYCPLLGQLAGAAHPLPLLARIPAGPAPSVAIADGHATLRPHGLHARGPPTPA